MRALAEVLGWPCEIVIAAIREPSDFAGLPVVGASVDGNGSTARAVTFAPPRWAERLANAEHGLRRSNADKRRAKIELRIE